MRKLLLTVSAAGLIAACDYTSADLRAEPVRFTATVATAWDRVATCVKTAYMDKYSVVDLPISQERRTEVVVQQMATFDIRTAAAGTVIVFRRRAIVAGAEKFDADARQTIEGCT